MVTPVICAHCGRLATGGDGAHEIALRLGLLDAEGRAAYRKALRKHILEECTQGAREALLLHEGRAAAPNN